MDREHLDRLVREEFTDSEDAEVACAAREALAEGDADRDVLNRVREARGLPPQWEE